MLIQELQTQKYHIVKINKAGIPALTLVACEQLFKLPPLFFRHILCLLIPCIHPLFEILVSTNQADDNIGILTFCKKFG